MKQIVTLVLVSFVLAPLSQADIINGTFELGNAGFTTEYIYAPAVNTTEGEYTVRSDPENWNGKFAATPDHSSGIGKMLVVNGATQGNPYFWQQDVSVLPSMTYMFSAWVSSAVAGGPADLLLEINGVTVGPSFTAPEETGTWDLWARMWDSGTDEVADIRLYNTDMSWYPNDFYVDDIFFVPEPVSFWLVCLGGTALLRTRRSRALTCPSRR